MGKTVGGGKSTPKRLSLSASADDEPLPIPQSPDIFSSPDQAMTDAQVDPVIDLTVAREYEPPEKSPEEHDKVEDTSRDEELIPYATIEVLPEEPRNVPQQQQTSLQREARRIAAVNSKLSPVKAIKKFHKFGKKIQMTNATIENLRVLKKELRWHQRKVKRLQKLILDMTKDLAIMTDSGDEAGGDSSSDDNDQEMMDAQAPT